MENNKKLIFLTGQMGSGKSYLGKKIAAKLDLEFIDTDAIISDKEQKSITEIFETEGESVFRSMEQNLLNELINLTTPAVIATGGGFPCFNTNADIMHQKGLVIHLKASENLLKENLREDTNHRPLLQKEELDIITFLKKQYTSRKSHYEKAHILVSLNSRNDGYEHLIDRLFPFFKPSK
jgi:shikimate kinase